MNIELMRTPIDCETAAIATVTQVSYEAVDIALGRVSELQDDVESAVFGNPLTVYLALIRLGFWKKNIDLTALLDGKAEPFKTIVLVKKSVTMQHWVVYTGMADIIDTINYPHLKPAYGFLWGDSKKPRYYDREAVIKMFTEDGPVNDAFIVYKCNIFTKLFQTLWINIRSLIWPRQ